MRHKNYVPIENRFWTKVNKTDTCWLWTSNKHREGYGLINAEGTTRYAHRISWQLTHGSIPEGMHVLHKCDNPPCVNPEHLFLGTHADNMRDKTDKKRIINQNTNKTHCKWGHEFTTENTRIAPRGRYCRACDRLRARIGKIHQGVIV